MKNLMVLLLLFLGVVSTNFSQSVWTIGPMFHWNIGGKKSHFSGGVEFACWNWRHFPYSIDGGLEFGRRRIRIFYYHCSGFL